MKKSTCQSLSIRVVAIKTSHNIMQGSYPLGQGYVGDNVPQLSPGGELGW